MLHTIYDMLHTIYDILIHVAARWAPRQSDEVQLPPHA